MIKIIWIPNIVDSKNRKERVFKYNRDLTIKDYMQKAGINLDKNKVILSGKKIEDLTLKPKKNEDIIITPDVELFSTVAGMFWFWGSSLIYGALQIAAVSGMVAYGIYSMVSNPRKPVLNTATPNSPRGIDESSPTYGWDGIQTIQDVGVPVPILYGEHKVGGNIINSFIRYDGDDSYLNVLLSLCEGEVYSISDVKINENPASNYDDVTTTTRMGTNSQSAIDNFEDAHNIYSVNVDLPKDNPYVYTTVDNDVEALEIHLSCPGGLFSISGEGGMGSSNVTYKIEYKVHTDPAYTDLGETTVSASSRSAVRRIYRIEGLSPEQYDVRVTKTSEDSGTENQRDLKWVQIDEIKTDNLSYPNTALLGIEAMATNQLSGSMPNFSCIVKGRKVSAPVIMNGAVQIDWEDYYWDSSSSQFKLLSDDTVLSWDGTSYSEQYCANPIWCIKDLLTNSRYGLGEFITSSFMSDTQLVEMAKYCEEKLDDGNGGYEKRFRLDVVIDGGGKALDVISQLATVFRGLPFYSAGNINLRIDKPGTPVQVFGMGNILKDTFNQSWKSIKEKPNVVEVQYLNKDKDYKQETIGYIDEAAITAGDPLRKKTVKLFTTRTSQAMREARYALKVAKYIDRTINFKASIDAIACQAGDLIAVSHDVLNIGSSGRVLTGGTTTSVPLDQSVTLQAGETYKLRIQFSDDTIEEKTVSTGSGTHSTIEVVGDPFTSAPSAYDKYMIGTSETVKEDFRIISMSKDNKFEVDITAIAYDEDVYDDTAVTLPEDNTSNPDYTIPPVSDLQLNERIYTRDDGTVESAIDVYFLKPDLSDYSEANRYKGANVYIREDSDAAWRFAGYTESDHLQITGNLSVGTTYYICVTSVPYEGNETAKSTAPNDSITLAGKTSAPSDVTNFDYDFTDELLLTWDKVSDADIAGYEIRDTDSSWGVDNPDLVYRGAVNSYTYRPGTRSPGTLNIKAYNTSGVYSDNAVTVTPTNSAPGAPTGFASTVFFNIAQLDWSDVADADIQYYEVYRSESNAWTGEEALECKVSGKMAIVEARKPTDGEADSATDSTVVDADLIGEDDDFCVGDIIKISTGDNAGEEKTITEFDGDTGTITISGTWSTNPSATDKFYIYDKSYFKVRAVDSYGNGTFSSSLAVAFETLTEASLGDNIVTARKVTTGELITLAAQIKDAIITAAKIADATITNAKIANGTIENAKIKDGTIESAKISSLDANKISASQLDAITANTGTLSVDEEITVGENTIIDGDNEVIKVYSDNITIESNVNDMLDWLENDGTDHTYATTLTAGDYTPADLATHIQTLMRTAGDSNTTVTWDSTTKKFTIANSTLSALTLEWSTGANDSENCGQALGFDITADDSGSLSYTGDEEATLRVKLGKLS